MIAMDSQQNHTEVRPVTGFDQVTLRSQHENHLVIQQGDQESLTIQAPEEILHRIKSQIVHSRLIISLEGAWPDRIRDALTTSLTRPRIHYKLCVKNLSHLEIYAMADVSAACLQTEELEIKYNGMGLMVIDDLIASKLEVEMNGAGRIRINGCVQEQKITVNGLAEYNAGGLKSDRATILLRSPGTATVWVTSTLNVDIRGPGGVSYYGSPHIHKRISPVGSLSTLGEPQTAMK
jgi:hypothetical protein